MNKRITYPIIITLICLVAAAGLALTFAKTKDRIAESQQAELLEGLDAVLPAGKASIDERPLKGVAAAKPKDDEKLYIARDADGAALATAAIGEAQGYSSKVRVLVGLTPEGEIIAIRILSQQETPGLGERTKEVPPTKTLWQAIAGIFTGGAEEPEREPPFQEQFRGKTSEQLELTKDARDTENILQLTGATITSQAVVDAVKNAIATIEAAAQDSEE